MVCLEIKLNKHVQASNAGLFVSRGVGTHPTCSIPSHELIFVAQGRLEMFENEKQYSLSAGETLLLRPNQTHGGTEDYPADLRFYWIHFTIGKQRLQPPLLLPQSTHLARPERMTELFRLFLTDQTENLHFGESQNHLLSLMLSEVARPPAPTSDSTSNLAIQAKQLIHTNFAEDISTLSLAQLLHCNPDYLGRVFRNAFDCTITEHIHTRRLQQAVSLLLGSPLNIDEIAYACGYRDPGYFRRLFKREYKHSPRQHRRMYANVKINTE